MYPQNDSLKKRAIRLLNNAKNIFFENFTFENIINSFSVIVSLLAVMYQMSTSYQLLYEQSGLFKRLVFKFHKFTDIF